MDLCKLSFFLMIFILYLEYFSVESNANSDRSNMPNFSLSKQRIIKELLDIGSQELLPCYPFNISDNEIGVRLHPTSNLLEW